MAKFDFRKNAIDHLMWKKRLRHLIDGREKISKEQLVSFKECDLGKWIYSDGLIKYKEIPEIRELEKIHLEQHMLIEKIVIMQNMKEVVEAEKEYGKIKDLDKKLSAIMTVLEMKIN